MRFDSAAAGRVREAGARVLDTYHLPGLAVGVVSGDDLVLAEGFGYADIESQTAMTPEHRQRIASITKTMAALCVMALVEEGRLSLDDRVVDLLPELMLRGPADRLSVCHLLTHTSGIGEVPNAEDLRDPFVYLFCPDPPPRSLKECYGGSGITIEVPPGTKYAYANHGYILLGEIIARIEDKPVREVLRDRIFRPLGMDDTDLTDQPNPGLATGYHRPSSEDEREMLLRMGRETPEEAPADGHNVRGAVLYTWGNGAQGGVQSTVPDMARYAAALLRGGGGIVRPETLAQMTSEHWRPDPRLPGRGLGFGLRDFWGRTSYGHNGEYIGGWHSYLSMYPGEQLALVVHANATTPHFESSIVPALLQAVFDQPPFAPPEIPIEARILETAPGVYEAPTPGPLTNFRAMANAGRVQLSVQQGALTLHARRGLWKTGVRLLPADPAQPDLFALATGDPLPAMMVLLRDQSGAVSGLRFPQLIDMHRTEAIEPWA